MLLSSNLAEDSPQLLRLAAKFINEAAALREVPTGTLAQAVSPPVPLPQQFAPHPQPVPIAPPAPSALPTAEVVPFPLAPPAPPIPSAPIAMATGGSTLPPNLAPVYAPPMEPTSPSSDEFDSAGLPWDGRIHQKGKSTKKDGTWKLQKGIDQSVVDFVLRQLAPRMRRPTVPVMPPVAPPAVGALAPVPLPSFPAPQEGYGQAPPAPSAAPAPPAPQVEGLAPFAALIAKITQAVREQRITQPEVNQMVIESGVPSIQALHAMPHKVPEINAQFDAIMLSR